MELSNHAKQLLLQLNQQRSKGFFCDVIIVVENALFRAHKNILAASSMYFKSLVLHDNLINLDTDMVNAAIFRQILDFIYTGKLPMTEQASEQNVNGLLTAASYLQLHDLTALCRKKMKRNGKTLHHGKLAGGPNPGKPGRGHRLPSTPVIQSRFAGSSDGLKRLSAMEPGAGGGGGGEEFYVPGSNKGGGGSSSSSSHPRGLKGGNGNANGGDQDEQMLGLDLSKKSPPLPTAQHQQQQPPHVVASQEDMQLGECGQGSPNSSTANTEDRAEGGEGPDRSEGGDGGGQGAPDTKGYHRLAPHHPPGWIKHEMPYGRQDNCREDGSTLMNGVIMGPLVKSLDRERERDREREGPHPYCKEVGRGGEEEEENGKEYSEESGQSEEDTGQPSAHAYRPGPDGFEPVVYGDNLYVCIPCGKGFPSSEQLNSHVESHTEEDLYIKDEEAVADGLAAQSLAFAGDSRPYKCSVCEKSYRDPSTLRQHEKTHWLSRPFPCNICGKMFTQRGTMTRHMRSHLGLKPFACEECGMRFTRQYRLTEHMRVHSGEKPYECQVCGGKFTQQRNLISHMRMHTSPT